MSVIKDTQAERLELLELIAYWEGRVNSTLLTRHFGLSRQQASGILSRYNALAPGNLYYSSSAKAYLANETFAPLYISADATDYLNWLNTGHLSGPHARLPHEDLQLPPRQVSVAVMRGLIIAIREQRRLEVDYVSLSNPNREGRIIAPHTFVKTGLRWHLRAWCEKSKNYRDFVLSRFRGTPQLLNKTAHTGEQDTAWHTEVTVVLQPDPRLSAAKRQVLEEDYQMHQSKLHITTRACLVQYLLNEMQINIKVLDGTPEAQQLVLVNKHDIKEWLFEG